MRWPSPDRSIEVGDRQLHHQLVARLIGDIGFRAIDLGGGAAALEAVDGLARLWFLLAFGRGYGRRVGFRILTADDETPAAG